MSFDTFVHWTQSILGILLQSVTLIGSIVALIKTFRSKENAAPTEAKRPPHRLWMLVFAILFLIFLTLFVIYLSSPGVKITEPADGKMVAVILHADTGSSEFRVRGTASHIKSNSSRRIYLLVHPDDPPAPGWWIQPAVSLDSDGNWSNTNESRER